jgi:hypothetical protein
MKAGAGRGVPEWLRYLLLAVLAGGLLVLQRRNPRWLQELLQPAGRRDLLEALRGWWAAAGMRIGLIVLAAALVVGLIVGGGMLWRAVRRRRAEKALLERVASGPTVQLLPRADWKRLDPEDVQVWVRLADALPHDEHLAFEIGGNQDGLAFSLHGSAEGVRAALTQFRAEWPGVFRKAVAAEEDLARPVEGWAVWWVELAPAAFERAVQAASADPLRAVLIELNGVLGQGRGLVQVIARRNFGVRKALGERAFAAREVETPSKGVRALRTQEAKELEARARATYLDVTVRVVGLADTSERAQGIARGLARAIAASFDSGNPVQPVRQGSDPQIVMRRAPGRMAPWSASDLAFLAHLAGSDLLGIAPRLATAPARYLPADPEMRFDAGKHHTAFLEEQR